MHATHRHATPGTSSHTVLVDSRDRDFGAYPTPNAYRVRLPTTYRNVVAARLLSAEVPRSFYVFSSAARNTSFDLTLGGQTWTLRLPDGNYTLPSLAQNLVVMLEGAIDLAWRVLVSPATNKLTMMNDEGRPFSVAAGPDASNAPTDWGLLYYLGFDKPGGETAVGRLESPRPATFHGVSYVLLDIEELRGVSEGGMYGGQTGPRPLAKLAMDPSDDGMVIMDTAKCLFELCEQRPAVTKLHELHVSFRFHDLRAVDFNMVDHSFALQLITDDAPPEDAMGDRLDPTRAPRAIETGWGGGMKDPRNRPRDEAVGQHPSAFDPYAFDPYA